MRYAFALLVLVLATPGAAATAQQGAARFAVTATTQRWGGHAGLAWDKLHPAQQRLITRRHFIHCMSQAGGDVWHLYWVKYVRSRTIAIHYRGVPQTRATRVWMRYKARSSALPYVDTLWVDVVRVKAKLRWLLDRWTADQLRRDPANCWE